MRYSSVRSWTLLGAVCAGTLSAITVAIGGGSVSALERQVFSEITSWPEWLGGAVMYSTNAGFTIVVSLLVIAALYLRRYALLLSGAGALAAAWTSAELLKIVFGRGRPADIIMEVSFQNYFPGLVSNGFPSGHAAMAAALATVVALNVPRRWAVVAVAVALFIGFGRIYLGVHLPLDVIGGWSVGILVGFAFQALHLRLLNRFQHVQGGRHV